MTTANLLDTIQPALRDRLEVIRVSGYTEGEKLEIAKRHLLPKQLEENGLTEKNLTISDAAIKDMIIQYTNEAGLGSSNANRQDMQESRSSRREGEKAANFGSETFTAWDPGSQADNC